MDAHAEPELTARAERACRHRGDFHTRYLGRWGNLLVPSASLNDNVCGITQSVFENQNDYNYAVAKYAIQAAETGIIHVFNSNDPSMVNTPTLLNLHFGGTPASMLGAAVHPYGYSSPQNEGYWFYYYNDYGTPGGNHNGYAGDCHNMQYLLNTWLGFLPSTAPLVFTEINWTHANTSGNCGVPDGCATVYLLDLFTWLHNHPASPSPSWDTPSTSQVRVMWYRGEDTLDERPQPPLPQSPHGIYLRDGSQKTVPSALSGTLGPDPNTCGIQVQGSHLSAIFQWMIQHHTC